LVFTVKPFVVRFFINPSALAQMTFLCGELCPSRFQSGKRPPKRGCGELDVLG
jgi:hypothetical protein